MSLTISEPLFSTPFQSAIAQSRREPYKWALSSIFTVGSKAIEKMQNMWAVEQDFTPEIVDLSTKPLTSAPTEMSHLQALKTLTLDDDSLPNLTHTLPTSCTILRTEIVPNPKIRRVVTDLLHCAAFRTYWNHALEKGLVAIRYASPTETIDCKAFTDEKTVVLNPSIKNKDLVYAIVFELGNVQNASQFPDFEDCTSADEFAQRTEEVEYETWLNTYRLCSQLYAEGLLTDEECPYLLKDEEYLHLTKEKYFAMLEENGHTDAYRNDWYDACDPEAGKAWREMLEAPV